MVQHIFANCFNNIVHSQNSLAMDGCFKMTKKCWREISDVTYMHAFIFLTDLNKIKKIELNLFNNIMNIHRLFRR